METHEDAPLLGAITLAQSKRSLVHRSIQVGALCAFAFAATVLATYGGRSSIGPRKESMFAESKTEQKSGQMNVVFVLVDDVGFNDFGPSSTDLSQITPNIGEIASDGVWLSNYYAQHICTPSRSTLLTGLYPIHSGMQHGIISGNDPWGLPLQHRLIPSYLQQAGFSSHMIGKWHLG